MQTDPQADPQAVDLNAILAIKRKADELVLAAIEAATDDDGANLGDLPEMAGELTGFITTTVSNMAEAGVELKGGINRTELFTIIREAVDSAEAFTAALDKAGAVNG